MTAAALPKALRRRLRSVQTRAAKRAHTHRGSALALQAVRLCARAAAEAQSLELARRAARSRHVDVATARKGRRRATLAAKRRARKQRLRAALEGMIR